MQMAEAKKVVPAAATFNQAEQDVRAAAASLKFPHRMCDERGRDDPIEPAPDPLTALRALHNVCVAMDAENDGEKPTESAYKQAMVDAEAAIEGAS
jgi:CelD/BcsL family acetyltransferase involved in cellulose biosynthesis